MRYHPRLCATHPNNQAATPRRYFLEGVIKALAPEHGRYKGGWPPVVDGRPLSLQKLAELSDSQLDRGAPNGVSRSGLRPCFRFLQLSRLHNSCK